MTEPQSRPRTVVRVAGADVALTLDDLRALERVLVDHLQQSSYEYRDTVLARTAPPFIDAGGRARIGAWLLDAEGANLVLRLRERAGPVMAVAHRATVVRQGGGWTVTALVLERIRLGAKGGGAVRRQRPPEGSSRR